MPWRPGRRAASRELEAPYEDVPAHLRVPLWEWISKQVNHELLRMLGLEFRIAMSDPDRNYPGALNQLREYCATEDNLLDVVEWLLETFGSNAESEELDIVLLFGNSAYRVRDDQRGLEMRVVPEVKDQVQHVVDTAGGSPGQHLATAWNEAYGRTADPVKAYSEAIKAVEAAAAPVISPQNLKATLGTMIRDAESKPAKWSFENDSGDGVDVATRMMKLLWQGQTSRHGGMTPTRPETTAEARAAVHLSATLVQFFVGQSFKLR